MKEQLNIDQLFQKAKTQPVAVSFETTKNQFLKHLSAGGKTPPTDGKGTFFTLKNVIIMISSILTISIAAVLLFPRNESTKPTKEIIETIQSTEEIQEVEFVIEEAEVSKTNAFTWPVLETKSIESVQSFRPIELILPVKVKEKPKKYVNPTSNYPYNFYPKLTEKEIADNHKQKKKMIKALAKFNIKHYLYVPSGSFEYEGQPTSVFAFYMQVNEVTNLEYRTFLFDLLIQGKKAQFDIAKPEQEKWTQLLGDGLKSMQNLYFSHEAFNEYPVCNVTRAGAEMYCEWLTQVTNATLDEEAKINNVRIPTRAEWYKAASNAGKQLPFPWEGGKITNETGCFLANYDAKSTKTEATCIDSISSDGALLTAKTNTYNPSAWGFYNLSGNVAEMVYKSERDFPINNTTKTMHSPDRLDKSKPGTAGGSWLNSEAEIKLNGPDPYDGVIEGHPGIGFRVVITYKRQW